jgi:hypothetical protein
MSDFSLNRESCEELLDYSVAITQFENDVEQRRLVHANSVIGYKITSPVLTYVQLQSYRNALINNYGALESFTFTSPFDSTEYNVRFEPGSFRTKYRNGVFQCFFQFKKVVT